MRELDADVVARRVEVHDFGVQRLCLLRVEVLHELPEPALGVERLRLLLPGALVGERDRHALVQERELAQTRRERVVVDRSSSVKICVVRLEPDLGAGLLLADVARASSSFVAVSPRAKVHVVLLAVALHPHLQLLGQRVDDATRRRRAVRRRPCSCLLSNLPPACSTVSASSTPGIFSVGWMSTGMPRPLSSTVIELSAWIVTRTVSAVAGERFVDRVVDDFVDEVVQSALGRRADVHARALANRLEALEYLDVARVVLPAAAVVRALCRHYSPGKNPSVQMPKIGSESNL